MLGMSRACFGGEPDRGATKAQNVSKLFTAKPENPCSLDRAWSQDSNESQEAPCLAELSGERITRVEGVSLVAPYVTCMFLVGNRTVVPQKHKIFQSRSTKNLKTYFVSIKHGLRIQMSLKKPDV